jgi:hypothetical protein
LGVSPVIALNSRWKWNVLTPALLASSSSVGAVGDASISRHASVTMAACCSDRDGWSGRQRLQGRNPACSASSLVAWKRMFSGRASREAHEGRQYTRVVFTE